MNFTTHCATFPFLQPFQSADLAKFAAKRDVDFIEVFNPLAGAWIVVSESSPPLKITSGPVFIRTLGVVEGEGMPRDDLEIAPPTPSPSKRKPSVDASTFKKQHGGSGPPSAREGKFSSEIIDISSDEEPTLIQPIKGSRCVRMGYL